MNETITFEAFQSGANAIVARLGGQPFAQTIVMNCARRKLDDVVQQRINNWKVTGPLCLATFMIATPTDFARALAGLEACFALPQTTAGSNTVIAAATTPYDGCIVLRATSLSFETKTAEFQLAHMYPQGVSSRSPGERWTVSLTEAAEHYLKDTDRKQPPTAISHVQSQAGGMKTLRRLAEGVFGARLIDLAPATLHPAPAPGAAPEITTA